MTGLGHISGTTFSTGFFLAAVIGIVLHVLFLYVLRRRCPDEWIRLGSPHPLRPDDIESGWMTMKYFLSGGFAAVNDKCVVTLGRIIQFYNWLFLIGFALVTVLFFYAIVSGA
jgi:hypothetical protein